MFQPAIYAERRRKLAASMRLRGESRGVILLHAHSESPINYPDNAYPFRQDSNWLYFVGLDEPDMAALIDVEDGGTLLCGDEISLDDMIWTGQRPGVGELAARSGIEEALPYGEALARVRKAAAFGLPVFAPPSCRAETRARVAAILSEAGCAAGTASAAHLIASIIELREIKDDLEVAEIERGVEVSFDMHSSLLAALRPGWTEARAADFVAQRAAARGCSLSFATIATVRGEILHNHARASVCGEDDCFLLDAGAETPLGYAGDLTTTFPVGKRFDARKAELYAVLLRMFSAAVEKLGPGRLFLEAHLAAALALASGLRDLGLLKGRPEDAVAEGAHALFFPHGIGHMIGLDVHDMEGLGEDAVGYGDLPRSGQFGLASLRLAKALRPGMVHSVEPGIYFIPGLIDRWEAEAKHNEFIDYGKLAKWRGCGGLRIEEDWLVLPRGARRLGPVLDKSVAAIEAARGNL
jgi:Xaa-Pro aminopeptidase